MNRRRELVAEQAAYGPPEDDMDYQTIQAAARNATGKGFARATRNGGQIPAVAYGAGGAAVSVTVDPDDILALKRQATGWNTPFNLAVEGGDDVGLVMLREVQRHPIRGHLLHVDFLRVAADKPVQVDVPLVLTGKAKGSELGGRLQQTLRSVTLECLPGDIPSAVEQDISDLDVGEKLALSQLAAPAGATLIFRHDASAVQIARGRGAQEDEEVVEETEEAAEEAEE